MPYESCRGFFRFDIQQLKQRMVKSFLW
ncbi:MAG: hypothetical protein K0S39_5958, partial [Paenibacillus sp.]|nr:hypothetical protein [Paenibacillus sp.]